jgi:hypothetical protein
MEDGMPCRDEGNYEHFAQQKIDVLTSMLCGLCSRVDQPGFHDLIDADPILSQWWRDHRRQDEMRRARELKEQELQKLRDKAKAKLTPEEQQLLGLR